MKATSIGLEFLLQINLAECEKLKTGPISGEFYFHSLEPESYRRAHAPFTVELNSESDEFAYETSPSDVHFGEASRVLFHLNKKVMADLDLYGEFSAPLEIGGERGIFKIIYSTHKTFGDDESFGRQ